MINPIEVTYPIFITQETSKKFLMFWRNGISGAAVWERNLYNDDGTWGTMVAVDDGLTGTYQGSTTRSSYHADIATFGNDIHKTWTWREGLNNSATTNHDLMYAISHDAGGTWYNKAGTLVGNSGVGSFKMNVNSAITDWGIPYTAPNNWYLLDNNSSCVDSNGNTHVIFSHAKSVTDPTNAYWYYLRIGGTWTRTMLPFVAGQSPRMFIDRASATLYVVSGLAGHVKVYGANVGSNNWGTWVDSGYSSAASDYIDLFNGRLSDDGKTLWIEAQHQGTSSSALDVIKLALKPNP